MPETLEDLIMLRPPTAERPLLGSIVLVVEADRTSAADIALARRDLQASGGNVIGVVMNRVGADAAFVERVSA